MGKRKYQIVSSEPKFEGEILKVFLDEVVMPDGKVHEREVVKHQGAVAIIPVTNRKVVLVKQYRHPIKEALLEIPAGKLDPGEKPLDCAMRELEEETGYKTKKLIKLADFHTTPGYSNELLHLYFAGELEKGEQKPEGGEELDLEVVNVGLNETFAMIASGEIKDAKTIIGLCLAEKYLSANMS